MKKLYLIALSIFLASCALQQGQMSRLDYLERGTRADIKEFFNGKMHGFAIVQNEFGDISDTLTIDVDASWEGDKGVIKKDYKYANGDTDSRTWLVTVDGGGSTFTAIGHDVASPAKGRKLGNAIQMTYSLLLPGQIVGQKQTVNFDDKYYLVDDKSAIVISQAKAGFGSVKKTIVSLRRVVNNQRNEAPRQSADEVEKLLKQSSFNRNSSRRRSVRAVEEVREERRAAPVREFAVREPVQAPANSVVERTSSAVQNQFAEPNVNEVISSEVN